MKLKISIALLLVVCTVPVQAQRRTLGIFREPWTPQYEIVVTSDDEDLEGFKPLRVNPFGVKGLNEGDIIQEIDGNPVITVQQLRIQTARQRFHPGEPLRVKIRRGQEVLVVPVFAEILDFGKHYADVLPPPERTAADLRRLTTMVQQVLNSNGIDVPVTGEWGAETQAALQRFISAQGRWPSSGLPLSADAPEDLKAFFEALDVLRYRGVYNPLAPLVSGGTTPTCIDMTQTITYVQEILSDQLGVSLPLSGTWDEATDKALTAYVRLLMQREPWSQGWKGSSDRGFTIAIHKHLLERVDVAEKEIGERAALTEKVLLFADAMDCLLAEGLYPKAIKHEPLIDPSAAHPSNAGPLVSETPSDKSDPIVAGNVGSGFMLSLANGFLYEFADEIGCKVLSDNYNGCHQQAKQDILAAQAKGGWLTAGLNFIGIMFSPVGFFVAAFRARSLHKTGGSAFALGFKYEAFENALAAIGEIATFGTLQYPGAFFQWALVACVLTGILVALRSR